MGGYPSAVIHMMDPFESSRLPRQPRISVQNKRDRASKVSRRAKSQVTAGPSRSKRRSMKTIDRIRAKIAELEARIADLRTFNVHLQFTCATGAKSEWMCFNPATSSIWDQVPLAQGHRFRCNHRPDRRHGRRPAAFCLGSQPKRVVVRRPRRVSASLP
jgi:hypothetical protein